MASKEQILVEEYGRFMALAVSMLGSVDDAKDIVQDAVLACLESSRCQEPFRYCMRSIRNRCIDLLRKKKYIPLDCSARTGKYIVRSSWEEQYRAELLEIIRTIKDKLPLKDVRLLELYYEEGLTMKDVALKLNCSRYTVLRNLGRIKSFLKEFFQKENIY